MTNINYLEKIALSKKQRSIIEDEYNNSTGLNPSSSAWSQPITSKNWMHHPKVILPFLGVSMAIPVLMHSAQQSASEEAVQKYVLPVIEKNKALLAGTRIPQIS